VIYIFDNYTLDGNKRELRDREVVVQLQPCVFDLLEFLLRNRDRVVSKDEMPRPCGAGGSFRNPTLASRINAARYRSMQGEDQRLIRTFLRKGRFVGLAREVQASSVAGTAKPERLADGSASEPSALPSRQ
jgi:DNA-binding winged helix-turn-helix (wHTH) protein